MNVTTSLTGTALCLGLALLVATPARPAGPPSDDTTAGPDAGSGIEGAGFSGGSPMVIPAAAFSSDGIDPGNYRFYFATGAIEGAVNPPSGFRPCLKAPAYLPQGAPIYQFWASIYDNDPVYNVQVTLKRVDNYSGVSSVMASVNSTGASTGIQSVADYSIDSPVVAFPNFSYYVTVCLNESATKLYSVRIWYSILFRDGFESADTSEWSSSQP